MTLQEIFDAVAVHLLTQKERSLYRPGGINSLCAYRGENGLTCAVGCLIPDELYDPSMESKKPSEEVIMHIIGNSGEPYGSVRSFLLSLQTIHDTVDPENWKGRLATLAAHRDLNNAVLHRIAR